MGCSDLCYRHGFTLNRQGQCVVCTPPEKLRNWCEDCRRSHVEGDHTEPVAKGSKGATNE